MTVRTAIRPAGVVLLDIALSLLQLFTPRPLAMAVFAALSLAYFVGCEAGSGRTPGHRVMGLRVLALAGGRPSAYQALRRHLVDLWPLGFVMPAMAGYAGPVTVLAALVGALAIGIALHRGRLPWHDRLAGTRVVVTQAQASRLHVHA